MTPDHVLDKDPRAESWADIVDDLLRENFYARTPSTRERKPYDPGSSSSREHLRRITALLPRSIRI